jgi:hypothetical protein
LEEEMIKKSKAVRGIALAILGYSLVLSGCADQTGEMSEGQTTEEPGGPLGNVLAEKLTWLPGNAENNGEYIIELDADERIGEHTLSYGKSIRITLRGKGSERTVTLSGFTVGEGVTLILDSNITLQGRHNSMSLVFVKSGGTLVMNRGAKISGNTNINDDGGGVTVWDGGTFIMNGGTISGNSARKGGGVYVGDGGTFTMSDGTISGNTGASANTGGGVYVGDGGTFTMRGGTISGNTASNEGGGVFVFVYWDTNRRGTFTMEGGTISGNTAYSGGGVNVWGGTFTMRGGAISGNTASSEGGGVVVRHSYFEKTGGTIYGYPAGDDNSNKCEWEGMVSSGKGHAVYVSGYDSSKYKDTTAGPGDNLMYDPKNGDTFSGPWDN